MIISIYMITIFAELMFTDNINKSNLNCKQTIFFK